MSTDEVVTVSGNNNSAGTDNRTSDQLNYDETPWSKKAFGEARLIFAVLPPVIIVIGVLVNMLVLILTAVRRESLHRHPVCVYIAALCACFCGILVIDSGLWEWASFITSGPITGRAHWLCRGVPFAANWLRTSACWLTVCALADRCLVLAAALRSKTSAAGDATTGETGEVGSLLPTDSEGQGAGKTAAGGSVEDQNDGNVQPGCQRPLFCPPVVVMLLTAAVFVAMAFANSPQLIRQWNRLQTRPSHRCVVPTRDLVRLSLLLSYGTTAAPLVVAVCLLLVAVFLLAINACRRGVPDSEDTNIVLVMSSPVALCLFVVELLRELCRHKVVDNYGGVVQEVSDLSFYAVIAVFPALCFAVAPSLRLSRQDRRAAAAAVPATAADETIMLSTVDGHEASEA